MAKKATINQYKYDAEHCRNLHLKLHTTIDADILGKLSSVPSMQGYIKQVIRDDLSRTQSGCVPISLSAPVLKILEDESNRTGVSVPSLVSTIVNESIMRLLLSREGGQDE